MVNEKNVKTWIDTDDRAFEFRVGMYPNWFTWNGHGHPFIHKGDQYKKTLFIDAIGFGPEFSDADPYTPREGERGGYKKILKIFPSSNSNITKAAPSLSTSADCIGFGCS